MKISFSNLNKIQGSTYLVIVRRKYQANKEQTTSSDQFAGKNCQFVEDKLGLCDEDQQCSVMFSWVLSER